MKPNFRYFFLIMAGWGLTVGHGDAQPPVVPEYPDTGQVTISVSPNDSQPVRFGIDAERLWHWQSNLRDELAAVAVGELQVDYVRVAINGAYEREKGKKDEHAYSQILEMMTAMRKANPAIHFFASPRPIHEAYTKQEKIGTWEHLDNVPFSPFPLWVQLWEKTDRKRKMKDGTMVSAWRKGKFDVQAWVQYYADYLNFMHRNGFDIRYMDVTNEQTIVSPAHVLYLFNELPRKLDAEVAMPLLVAPSSWSTEGATNWLQSVDRTQGEDKAFAIAASHNTGKAGSFSDFVREAQQLEKEPWNSELHGWIGTNLKTEILTSNVLWEHLRAGYTGLDSWLFFGPLKGRDHTMINASSKQIIKSGKYEIFKQVVNHANGGRYVDITKPTDQLETAAFVKDGVLTVWLLNRSEEPLERPQIRVEGRGEVATEVHAVKWNCNTSPSGEHFELKVSSNILMPETIAGQSLYFFKIKFR